MSGLHWQDEIVQTNAWIITNKNEEAYFCCVFVPYSPFNINQVYANGETLTDAWNDAFLASNRRWQESYQRKGGNWMAPCIVRDHDAVLRQLIAQYEPDPDDESARQALLDGDYARGMDAYDKADHALTQDIWPDHQQGAFGDTPLIYWLKLLRQI